MRVNDSEAVGWGLMSDVAHGEYPLDETMGAKESRLFRRGHANRHHVTVKVNRKLVAVRYAWHLAVCGNQSFHGVAPIRFFVSAGFRSSHVAVAVWLSVLPFDIKSLGECGTRGNKKMKETRK